MKLSGVAVPSCCCGSSQRAAMLVCQARVILPCGTTASAAPARRMNGIAVAVAAIPAVEITVRRVIAVLWAIAIAAPPVQTALFFLMSIAPILGRLCSGVLPVVCDLVGADPYRGERAQRDRLVGR